MRKHVSFFVLPLLTFCCFNVCSVQETAAAEVEGFTVEIGAPARGIVDDFDISEEDIVILYNNDVHGGISADKEYSGSAVSLGYAGMAGVKADVAKRAAEVTTIDLGDAIQGSTVTTETDGQAVIDLMEMIGYDILIPGNHEFDYGMDFFLEYADNASGKFISCNFIDNRTGEPVFDSYTLAKYDVNGMSLTVGFIGISTPETIAKSTPTYFQDEDGNYIYGFDAATPQDLYDDVQQAIDAAYEDGADIVIALGHMGDTGVEPDWSSLAVIENTTGISAFLDGHAHSEIDARLVKNKDGEDVLLTSTGTKLEHIGLMKLEVAEDGKITISSGLVDKITDDEKKTDEYSEVYDAVQEIEDAFSYLFVVSGRTDFDLVIYDPKTGERIIRNAETNLGDFLSDVYRNYFDADIAFLNGGSIRANIDEGDITFMDELAVYPWNTTTGVVEVTGQVILDCLEMGAHLYPEECGGWIVPSGITYMVDSTIPSNVTINADGEFVSVDGEYRIKNVMVGDEPLDLEKSYKLAINTYYSAEFGDGMTMFKDCKVLVPGPGESPIVDHDVLTEYIEKNLGGKIPEEYADPYGQGRYIIITDENKYLLETGEVNLTEPVEEATTEIEEVVKNPVEAETAEMPEYDFKTFKWGDSETDIREVEGENVSMENDMPAVNAHYIVYNTTVAGLDAFLAYYFCDEGLYETRYILKEKHSNDSLYIDDYKKIENAITKKYGDPLFGGENWDNDRHKEYYADDKGNALSFGYLTYNTWYFLPRTTILMDMSADNFEISTTISYSSNTISPGDADYSDDF